MKNFDIDNVVNPELIQSALVEVNGKLHRVMDMDLEAITVEDSEHNQRNISDKDWQPITLEDSWMSKLIGSNQRIANVHTGGEWIIKKCGPYYYLTVYREHSMGENPIIPIHFVHELQEWYYRLTKTNLRYNIINLSININ